MPIHATPDLTHTELVVPLPCLYASPLGVATLYQRRTPQLSTTHHPDITFPGHTKLFLDYASVPIDEASAGQSYALICHLNVILPFLYITPSDHTKPLLAQHMTLPFLRSPELRLRATAGNLVTVSSALPQRLCADQYVA